VYVIVVRFDVDPDFRERFIAAALLDGRDSIREEPGTHRFELVEDAETPNRFVLSEGYDDEAAFALHVAGRHFKEFFATIDGHVDGPHFLVRGHRVE